MPSGAMTSAGTTMAVSAALPATYNATGYGALTFVAVGEVTVIPAYGKQFNLVTHNPLADRKTYKYKGSYNNGSASVQMAKDVDDAGQVIIAAGVESDAPIAVEITLQDGSIEYSTALIMGYPTEVGSVDSITASTVIVEFSEDVVSVAA